MALLKRLRVFRQDDEGAATIEFVLVFPVLLALVFSVIEAGWLMTRSMLLERGVSIAVRDLQLGYANALTHNGLRDAICDHSGNLANCKRDLILEVVPMDVNASYPQNQANCIDRTGAINPKIDFNPGQRGEVVFVRACMIIDPIIPGMGLGLQMPKDASGGVQMVAYTAFMNEPA